MKLPWSRAGRTTEYFADFTEGARVFRRRSHDDVPENDYALVMLTDPEGIRLAQAAGLSELVVFQPRLFPSQLRDDRMPDGEVVNVLRQALDDRLGETFNSAMVPVRLVGTQTGGGQRVYFLLTNSPARVRDELNQLGESAGLTIGFPEFEHATRILEHWLVPDFLESRAATDDQVREVFREHGDNGEAPRDTKFFFYGGDIAGLEQAAASHGFAVENLDTDGLALSKTIAITADELCDLNRLFQRWVDAFGVDYDGWEAQLLT